MAKRKTNRRVSVTEQVGSRDRSFRGGDLVLVLMVLGLTALVIVVSALLVPTLRNQFLEKYEDLTFTVALPTPLMKDLSTMPKEGDSWKFLDSEDSECTVVSVEASEELDTCYVTLRREKACYRVNEGYTIADTRIAVGSTLYFRCDPDLYFAVTVTQISSERFPSEVLDANTAMTSDDEIPDEITTASEVLTDTQAPDSEAVTEASVTGQETTSLAESGEGETNAETE